MLTLVFAGLLSTVLAAHHGFKDTGNLEWMDCAPVAADSWIKVTDFDITPSPIKVPGKLRVKLDSQLKHFVQKEVAMDVKFQKELLGTMTDVTCVKDVGTCHYDDPCHFLTSFSGSKGCPKQLTDNGLPCTCPFNPQAIKLPNAEFEVTNVSSQWSFLATGSYHIKVTMTENKTKKVRACFETYLKIQH